MLAIIHDNTWNVRNMQHIILKDPPTWLKVATKLEKPPTPTHWQDQAITWTNNELKSESHSEAPFNLFQAPLTTCTGSLLWSTPLQNSLISVKIPRAGEFLPHSLNARALLSIRQSPRCLMFTMGIPWKVVFWYWDRFQSIDFFFF